MLQHYMWNHSLLKSSGFNFINQRTHTLRHVITSWSTKLISENTRNKIDN